MKMISLLLSVALLATVPARGGVATKRRCQDVG